MYEVLAALPSGFVSTFSGMGVIYLIAGTIFGFFFGVMPGLGGITALAILIPFSWGMETHQAMLMFAGSMGAIAFGGSISAILLNVPGTPQNLATTFDGFPMAQQGRAGEAIGTAAASSALGAIFGLVILVLFIPLLRAILMNFGPPEFFMLILFGLITIPLFTGRNFIGGLIAGGLGLTLSFIGFSGTTGVLRYNFGTLYLYDGIPLVPVVMGLFAISQAIELIGHGGAISKVESKHKFSDVIKGVKNVYRYKVTFLRSSALGTIIGIIPGLGGVVSNIFAWIITAQSSPRKAFFGTGEVEGIVASESANDSKDGGALLPTLAFGIPGSGEMAVLMGAFILHGLSPGPQILRDHLDIVWTIILGLLFSNILVALIGVVVANHIARLTLVKGNIIAPIIVCATMIGTLVTRNEPIDMFVCMIFGFLGFLMDKFHLSRITLILGFILGHLGEMSFNQSLMISDGDFGIFIRRPISLGLLIFLVLLVVFMQVILPLRKRKAGKKQKMRIEKQTEVPKNIKPDFWKDMGLYLGVALFIWFVIIIDTGLTYPFNAGLFPVATGILSMALSIVMILGRLSPKIAQKLSVIKGSQLFDTSAAKEFKEKMKDEEKTTIDNLTLMKIALWFFGATILFFIFGYLPAIVIFLFAFLKLYARYPVKTCIAITVVSAIVALILFTAVLDVPPVKLIFM